MEGTITYVSGKGWFFAKCDDGNDTGVFVHQRDVENRRYLRLDDRIQFNVVPSLKSPGDLQAANVKFLAHAGAAPTDGAQGASRE
jgi:cold shock CspA family protein